MRSFASGQSNKNISVTELFSVREKQNASSDNFTTHTCVKTFFDHVYNAKAC